MGRPIKKGLDYFHLDTNSGDKVNYLRKKLGMAGYGTFVCLLNKIYKFEGYYCKFDNTARILFCEDGINIELLRQTVYCCFEIGLFDRQMFDKHEILTSKEIQTRYLDIISVCKRKGIRVSPEFMLVNSEEKPVNSEETQQRKENKSKVNESITGLFSSNFILEWERWLTFKKEQYKFYYKSFDSEFEAIKELHQLSGGSEDIAKKIILQSITKSWKGLFVIGGNNKKEEKKVATPIKTLSDKEAEEKFGYVDYTKLKEQIKNKESGPTGMGSKMKEVLGSLKKDL